MTDYGDPDKVVDTGMGDQPLLPDGLQRLWAPYRSAYLAREPRGAHEDRQESAPSKSGSPNPFKSLPAMADDEALIVARGELVFVLLNLFPYNPGHMMVLPYREVSNYEDLTVDEILEMGTFTQKALRVLQAVSAPDAVNIGFNLGRASGGSVPQHLHQHIVPRWHGDTSFMTVIAGAKILPQTLKDTRQLLATAWDTIDEN